MLVPTPGVLTLTLVNPVWVVKTRLCLTNTENVPHYMRYRGLREGLVNLYRYEGMRGLYKVCVTYWMPFVLANCQYHVWSSTVLECLH